MELGFKKITIVLDKIVRFWGKLKTSNDIVLENAKVRIVLLRKQGDRTHHLYGIEPLEWLVDINEEDNAFEFESVGKRASGNILVTAKLRTSTNTR